MRHVSLSSALLLTIAWACACGPAASAPRSAPVVTPPASASVGPAPAKVENPLLASWSGPFGGVPPFAKVKVEHFKPALEAAMDEYRREIGAIVENPAPPTFDNTIVALEDAGRTFTRVATVYDVWVNELPSDELKAVELDVGPKLDAFEDELAQSEKLWKRVDAVYQSSDKAKLTPEQQRLTWKRWNTLHRNGAHLDRAAKTRLAEIKHRLASLYGTFGQNITADEQAHVVILEHEADLAGLPAPFKARAAANAESRGQKGKWAISNTRSSMEQFLESSPREDLRAKVWTSFFKRADNDDAHDNKKVIIEILKLRTEHAKLLGYPTYAHWRLENTTAKTPEQARARMEEIWKPTVQHARDEIAELQKFADKDGLKRKIAPSDYRFYAEKVRQASYDSDPDAIQPYFQLDKIREGLFWLADELYGLTFTPVSDIEVYDPDMRVWEVKEKATGKHVGLWYFDPFTRPGKRHGTAMNPLRWQERFKGEVTAIVSHTSNLPKPKNGETVVISLDDKRALSHEFAKALQVFSSNVSYPSLAATRETKEYVEFPAQLFDDYLWTPELLNKFAIHVKTGAPAPKELVAKIRKGAAFLQHVKMLEYLSGALVDLDLHLAAGREIDPDVFERETLKKLGMPPAITMRYRTPQLSSTFASDSTAAGSYSFVSADILSTDAAEAFLEGKGLYDLEVAERLRKDVISVGDSIDPADGYRAFRGKDPTIDALMRKRGFLKTTAVSKAK